MELTIEICMPVAIKMTVAPLGDDDIQIQHAQLAAAQDITVRKIMENIDEETIEYILGKLKAG